MINKLKAIWNKKRKLSDVAINLAVAQLVLATISMATDRVVTVILCSIISAMFICTALILKGLDK